MTVEATLAAHVYDMHIADGVLPHLQLARVLNRRTQQLRSQLKRQPGRRMRSGCGTLKQRSPSWRARKPLWTRPPQMQVPAYPPAYSTLSVRKVSISTVSSKAVRPKWQVAPACIMCLFDCRAWRRRGGWSSEEQCAAESSACRLWRSSSRCRGNFAGRRPAAGIGACCYFRGAGNAISCAASRRTHSGTANRHSVPCAGGDSVRQQCFNTGELAAVRKRVC
jgi:hypothetical protein